MISVALSSVKGHFLRFLLTAFAVALGTAFVAGTLGMTGALDKSFTSSINSSVSNVDVDISEKENTSDAAEESVEQPGITPAVIEKIEKVDGVASVNPQVYSPVIMADKNGDPLGGGGVTAAGAWPVDTTRELVDGRLPQKDNEITVTPSLLTKSGYAIGDTVKLVTNGNTEQFTLVGTANVKGALGFNYVFFTPDYVKSTLLKDSIIFSTSVMAKDGVSKDTLAKNISAVLPSNLQAMTGDKAAEKIAKETKEQTKILGMVMMGFASISLVVGAFIIINTFLMMIGQRTRELAMLRAIGSRKRQVLSMVLIEAVAIGIIGSALGLLFGIVIGAGLIALIKSQGLDIPLMPPITPTMVITTFAVGIAITVLSALIPALKAARTKPVAAMSDQGATTQAPLHIRWILGALAAAGAATFAVATWGKKNLSDNEPLIYMGTIGGLLALAALFWAAPLAKWVIGALSAPFAKVGVVAPMARENSVRNARRTALTASALMIGLMLVTSVSVLVSSAEASNKATLASTAQADFMAASEQGSLTKEHVAKLSKVNGVDTIVTFNRGEGERGKKQDRIAGTTLGTLSKAFSFEVIDGKLTGLGEKDAIVTEEFAKDNSLKIGSTLNYTFGENKQKGDFTVAAIVKDNDVLLPVTVSDKKLSTLSGDEALPITSANIVASQGANLEEMKSALKKSVREDLVVTIQDRDEYIASGSSGMEIALYIVYGLLGLSIVIAMLGIANTLAMSLFERKRELGMLRAVGLKRGQLGWMVVIESLWTALFGAVLGVTVGIAIGWMGQHYFADLGMETFSIPWLTVAGVFALAALVGIIAAVVPALRTAHTNPLKAISAT